MFTMLINKDSILAKMADKKKAIPKALAQVVTKWAVVLHDLASARAPVRTGKLRRSIFQQVDIDETQAVGRVFVSPDTEYAKFMEYGTKPHDIFPNKANALRFMIDGKVIFAHHVKHPGTKPYLFVHGPFEENKDSIVADIENTIRDSAK